MELVLTIIAGIGLLLLIISYLAYAITGFRHHFVTGLISALPVLNIVTLPALWQKAGKKFLTGLLGLVIFIASWSFGADKGLNNLYALVTGNNKQVVSNTTQSIQSTQNSSVALPLPQTGSPQENTPSTAPEALTAVSKPFSNQKQRFIDNDNVNALPSKALYKMLFESVPVNKISSLNGRIIRVITNEHTLEGKVIRVGAGSVLIQSGGANPFEQEIPIATINKLQLMVKKAQ